MGNTMAPSPRSYGEGEPYEVEFQSEIQEEKTDKTSFTVRPHNMAPATALTTFDLTHHDRFPTVRVTC